MRLGAAFAAGLADGVWNGVDELRVTWREGRRWEPQLEEDARGRLLAVWRKAVTRTFDWLDTVTSQEQVASLSATLGGMSEPEFSIRDIRVDDAGQVMTLQRAAFASEALIYDSADMAPFTQTLDEVAYELRDNLGCVALIGERIVGAVRAVGSDGLLLVGRIAVAPDQQGEGIGSALLMAVEKRGAESGCRIAEIFTGSLSLANIALYEELGYRETTRVAQGDGIEQVFLQKNLDASTEASE